MYLKYELGCITLSSSAVYVFYVSLTSTVTSRSYTTFAGPLQIEISHVDGSVDTQSLPLFFALQQEQVSGRTAQTKASTYIFHPAELRFELRQPKQQDDTKDLLIEQGSA